MKPKEIKIGSAMLALMEEHRIGRDDLMRVLGMMEDEGATKQLDLLEPAASSAAKPEPQEPAKPEPQEPVKPEPRELVKPEPREPVKRKASEDWRISKVVEIARANGGSIHYREVMRAFMITKGASTGLLWKMRKMGLLELEPGNGTSRLVSTESGTIELKSEPKPPDDGRVMQVVALARANGGSITYQDVMRDLGITESAAASAMLKARKYGLMELDFSTYGASRVIGENTAIASDQKPRMEPRKRIGARAVLTWLETRPTKRAHFREVAALFNITPNHAMKLLIKLTRSSRVARVARGTYWVLPR